MSQFSEGLVAILEPFIDTIIICTVTGLVLLSSGVWNEKHVNEFQLTDLAIVEGVYTDQTDAGKMQLYGHISGENSLPVFNGDLNIQNGSLPDNLTIIHARSLAENVMVLDAESKNAYSGMLNIVNGKPTSGEVVFKGESLVHSAPLTAIAFQRGFFGEWGQYIVSIGLLLFAFSTAISWSYYGDRAMTFLFGNKSVVYYRIVYVAAFFLAAFTDTTIIWTLSGITIAVMTLPNLIGILILRKDMKETVDQFWGSFKKEWPDEKTPQ